MQFQQVEIEGFRICAVAFDCSRGGFLAGVEVHQVVRGSSQGLLVFRDEELVSRPFEDASLALSYAIAKGHEVISRR